MKYIKNENQQQQKENPLCNGKVKCFYEPLFEQNFEEKEKVLQCLSIHKLTL
jgi:hypothetical protein